MARDPIIKTTQQPWSRWRLLAPWAIDEPAWLALLAKLAGALLALSAVLLVVIMHSIWRDGAAETVIEGTIARTYDCNHRKCHRGRWILYIEGYEGLVSVPLRDVFIRLEAAGAAPVRVVATGDMAKEIYLRQEQILNRSTADNYAHQKTTLIRAMARWLAIAGILVWAITVGLRLFKRASD